MLSVPFTTSRSVAYRFGDPQLVGSRTTMLENGIYVNAETLRDIQRWGRDEIDEDTQAELWRSLANE